MECPRLCVTTIIVLLLAASAARAELTTEGCLAQKRQAHGDTWLVLPSVRRWGVGIRAGPADLPIGRRDNGGHMCGGAVTRARSVYLC